MNNKILSIKMENENSIEFWEKKSCGTEFTREDKYSKQYYEDIENYRYSIEPEIFSFAQFPRFYGKTVLEVGYGAGTDFLQWVRSGAKVYGVDITREGYENLVNRLKVYNLEAEDVKICDCQSLPYNDNFFDLVYSWGVIHCVKDTKKALAEIVRVCKKGGKCKIMVYNRHSLNTFYLWIKKALLKGRFWKSFSWCLYNYMESIGTKGYTRKEIILMLSELGVGNIKIETNLSYYDKLEKHNKFLQIVAKLLSTVLNSEKVGWFLTIDFDKK